MTLKLQQERQRIQQLIRLDNQSDTENKQYYAECMTYIREHLSAFFYRYATDNNLTVSDAIGRVSKWDLDQWKQAINNMDMSEWPQEALDQVPILAAKAGANRNQLMMAVLGLGVIGMTVKMQRSVEKRLSLDGQTEAKRMVDAFQLGPSKAKKVYSIITQPTTRAQWSSNLWIDSDGLANDVENLVNKHVKHGMSLDDLNSMLKSHVNPNQFKPEQSIADRVEQMEYSTERLIRTESARLIDEVNMTTYRMAGVKYVDWVTEPGACSKCLGLADGGPYAIGEAPSIPGDSHPNCRCHKMPSEEA